MYGQREDRIRDLQERYPVWRARTAWQRLCDCAAVHPESPFAFFEDGAAYTYAQAVECSAQVARALREVGVRRGTHVAVKLGNSPEYLFLIFALSKIGAVLVSVNTAVGPYEFGYSVANSDSAFVICDTSSRFEHDRDAIGLRAAVICPGTTGESEARSACAYWESLGVKTMTWDDMVSVCEARTVPAMGNADIGCAGAADLEPGAEDAGSNDPFAISNIMYTSGSTGNPKGVPLTADKLFRVAFSNCLNRGFEEGRRILVPLPLCHCFAFVEGLLSVLFVAGSIAVCSGRFDAGKVLRFAQRTKCNDIFAVPVQATKYVELLRREPMDFPSLHAMYCGGTNYDASLPAAVRQLFGIDDIVNGFGMTEMGGAVMQSLPGADDATVAGYVGRMMPAGCAGSAEFGGLLARYRVVADEEHGIDARPGEQGHLWVKGATLMEGYYHDPEKNAECFTADGWFKTGDLGVFAPDGYLRFLGRSQDTYRINGENVSTQLVETVLGECPAVDKAIVVGVPDARHGAVGAAFVQLSSDTQEARSSVESFARKNLARFQEPARYFYLTGNDWPLTNTGKVQKFKLRKIAQTRMKTA